MGGLKTIAPIRRQVSRQSERMREVLRRERERRMSRRVARRQALAARPSLWVETRRRIRLACIVVCTLAVFGLWLCCWPLSPLAPSAMRPIRRRLIQLWGAACLWIINMRLEVYGRAPKPPCFLVANHLSYVDIWVLSQQTGAVFVAKADMETWPLFGWFMKQCHQIFIRRESLRDSQRVIGLLNEVLDERDALVVFAEGRCSPGREVLSFRPSLYQVAAERRFPVHYAALTYETPEGEPAPADSISWWRWEPFGEHMKRLLRLSGSRARLYYGAAPVVSSDRKELARRTQAGCEELFTPLEQGILEELPTPDDAPVNLYPEKKLQRQEAEAREAAVD
ncbi:MAG: putative 1-acylglycerol-3-phosphate O-acyltransferase [Candidatus Hydrogenedentota bacterium]